MSAWSKQAQSDTRKILSLQNAMPFVLNESLGRKGVILKNSDGRFGCITLESCKSIHYQIIDTKTPDILDSYATIEELLSGGWVVD